MPRPIYHTITDFEQYLLNIEMIRLYKDLIKSDEYKISAFSQRNNDLYFKIQKEIHRLENYNAEHPKRTLFNRYLKADPLTIGRLLRTQLKCEPCMYFAE